MVVAALVVLERHSMKKKRAPEPDEIDLRPDGWERFEKAVDAAVKGGPQHRPKMTRKSGGSKPARRRTRRE
jgi:hypothetical protein